MSDINFENSMKIARAAVAPHGGSILGSDKNGLSHEIRFKAGTKEFLLTFRTREGRDLIDVTGEARIQVYDALYGFQGDKSDIGAVMAWIEQAPRSSPELFPRLVNEYLARE